MKLKSKLCCEKHIDMAFDDFLVDYETFPEMKKTEERHKCSYCNEDANYILKVAEDNK